MLAAIGIIKGQPFNPDAATRAIFDRAAKTAYKMSRVIAFEEKVSGATSSSIQIGDGSIPSQMGRQQIRAGHSICRGNALPMAIVISMRVSRSLRITTRLAPA